MAVPSLVVRRVRFLRPLFGRWSAVFTWAQGADQIALKDVCLLITAVNAVEETHGLRHTDERPSFPPTVRETGQLHTVISLGIFFIEL